MLPGKQAPKWAQMVRVHNSLYRRKENYLFHGANTTARLVAFFLRLEDLNEFLIVVVQVALKSLPVDQSYACCAGQFFRGFCVVGIRYYHGFVAAVEGLCRYGLLDSRVAYRAGIVFSLDHHVFAEAADEKICALVSSLLGLFDVVSNGLKDLYQKGFELKARLSDLLCGAPHFSGAL
jgi:hypothetical protein